MAVSWVIEIFGFSSSWNDQSKISLTATKTSLYLIAEFKTIIFIFYFILEKFINLKIAC